MSAESRLLRKVCRMIVSLTEFKSEIDRYLELVDQEEIIITKDDKRIARISPPAVDKGAIIRSLRGVLPKDASEEDAYQARIDKYENRL